LEDNGNDKLSEMRYQLENLIAEVASREFQLHI